MLIIVIFLVVELFKMFVKTKHTNIPKKIWNRNVESVEIIVNRLNNIWNRNPAQYIHDPHGYRSCLVFTHSFEAVTSNQYAGSWNGYCTSKTQFPWCPKSSVDVRQTSSPFKFGKVPLHGISFSAFNKYLKRPGKMLYGEQCGIIFEFESIRPDFSISPMCFYPTNASTLARNKCGCGGVGIQTYIKNDPEGNYIKSIKSQNKVSEYTKHAIHKNKKWFWLWKFHTIMQPPLNFSNFIKTCMQEFTKLNTTHSENETHNDIIIKSWMNVDFNSVPLAAFFVKKNDVVNLDKVKECALKFNDIVGFQIPVLYFDPYCTHDCPFETL